MTNTERQESLYSRADELLELAKQTLETCVANNVDFQHVGFPMKITPKNVPSPVAVVPLEGQKEKRIRQIEEIHKALSTNGCDAFISICDSKMTTIPKGMTWTEAIAQRDMGIIESQECLTMIVCGEGVIAKCVVSPYIRAGKKVQWQKTSTTSEGDSYMIPRAWATPVHKA